MFAWLFPVPVEPVLAVDPAEALLRYCCCDGSVLPGEAIARDVDADDPVAALMRLRASEVRCGPSPGVG